MIVFLKFFEHLKLIHKTQYSLIKDDHISSGLLYVLRHSTSADPDQRTLQGVRTSTIISLCKKMNCRPEQIMEQEAE